MFLILITSFSLCFQEAYPWPQTSPDRHLEERIEVPHGYDRIPAAPNSFALWLRGLPMKRGNPRVKLYNGAMKRNQRAHAAVVDMDTGKKDLQQCADAVMRLRAEYLFSRKCREIHFQFTSGDVVDWDRWREGMRPVVDGNKVVWQRKAGFLASYGNFRKFLEMIFIYSGSASLERESEVVANPYDIRPGDFFIQGGYPGHAVMVLDVAQNRRGERIMLLGQSYMPAQEFHVLHNPKSSLSPWYKVKASGRLETPEWLFSYGDLMRFPQSSCEPAEVPAD